MKAGIFILFAISIAIFAEQGNASPIQDVGDGEGLKHSTTRQYHSPSKRARRSIFR